MSGNALKGLIRALVKAGFALADFVYPPFCSICRKGLGEGERIVCEACWSRMKRLPDPRCPRCGVPSAHPASGCPNCAGKVFLFEGACVLSGFDGVAKELIHLLKYREKTSVGIRLGGMLALAVEADQRMQDAEVLVPVPLHRSRARERGYNQAAIIAKGLGLAMEKPVVEQVLIRRKATATQTKLSAEERRRNLEGAFAVRDSHRVEGRRILLVDDVLTTGATLNACAQVLRAAGAIEVLAAAVASPIRGESV